MIDETPLHLFYSCTKMQFLWDQFLPYCVPIKRHLVPFEIEERVFYYSLSIASEYFTLISIAVSHINDI